MSPVIADLYFVSMRQFIDKLKSGELKIAEPNKCLGYERYKIGEVDENELSNGAREIYKIVSQKYSYLEYE